MPCINRIRIINFAYNNDTRHILDETFDFHGGENALLNLANGGGKSVLVQLMLQPVVPRAKIQGRQIADFFRKRRMPAYVLLEWKLDGKAGYLLTGIGMASEEAKAADEDERGRIRHFCFQCAYSHAFEYDLANIELIRHENGLVKPMPYKDAQEMMREAARKNPYAISYFPQAEPEAHRRKLMEYGISQDEWKNVMTDINNSEGGLEELFSKCRTSEQLLDTWLLHTVEKNLPTGTDVRDGGADGGGQVRKDAGGGHGLYRMFEDLLEETLKSEGLLMEQQRLVRFLPSFEVLRDQAADVASNLEQVKTVESGMGAMYRWLDNRRAAVMVEKESVAAALRDTEEKQHHVRQEEKSEPVHVAFRALEAATSRLANAREAESSCEDVVREKTFTLDCLRAARVNNGRQSLMAKMAEIVEQLLCLREEDDRAGRLELLHAVLGMKWRERLDHQETLYAEAATALKETEGSRQAHKAREQANRDEERRLVREREQLIRSMSLYEAEEQRVGALLGIPVVRNLAGEASPNELDKITHQMDIRVQAAEKELEERKREVDRLADILCSGDAALRRTETECTERQRELERLEAETEHWRIWTEARKNLLQRYGLTGGESQEAALAALESRLHDVERRLSITERERHQCTLLQADLREGRFHTSSEWLATLAEAGCEFQTGEDYLRRLDTGERSRLLARMPLLPYAVLLTTEALETMPDSVRTSVSRGTTPLLTYEGLRGLMLEEERLVASCDNLRTAQKGLVQDLKLVADDPYPEDWKAMQEGRIAAVERVLVDCRSRMDSLAAEHRRHVERKDLLTQELVPQVKELVRAAQQQLQEWRRLLERNAAYEGDCRQLSGMHARLRELEKDAMVIRSALDILEAQRLKANRDVEEAGRLAREYRTKLLRHDAWVLTDETEQASGAALAEYRMADCDVLEARLEEMTRALDSDQKNLENRHQSLADELRRLDSDWKKATRVIPEGTELPAWDEEREERLDQELRQDQGRLAERRKEAAGAANEEARASERLKVERERLVEVGLSEPLPEAELHGRYAERMMELGSLTRSLKQRDGWIEKELGRCDGDQKRIAEEVPDLAGMILRVDFQVEDDGRNQLDRLLRELKAGRSEAARQKDAFVARYGKTRTDHMEGSSLIRSLFDGLDVMLERATDGYEPFFYLYERMQENAGLLGQQIGRLKAMLEGLVKSRGDVVEHCFLRGHRLVEELQRIEHNSIVRLEGRSTSTAMLKIDMKLDGEAEARLRMEQYVETAIEAVKAEVHAGKTLNQVRPSIERHLRSRELLNRYLGTPRIPVQVFKIDLNMGNSRFKIWEDAVRENSGGEKFVVYFSVLTALMAYTRAAEQRAHAGGKEAVSQDSGHVLIMDNPFGPISSQHLLRPLFDIAKRYRTQLICLTDLKQSSILNNFQLVYMLRVRKGVASTDEYLKFEAFRRSDDVPDSDEALEKAFYRVSDYKQMQMWE